VSMMLRPTLLDFIGGISSLNPSVMVLRFSPSCIDLIGGYRNIYLIRDLSYLRDTILSKTQAAAATVTGNCGSGSLPSIIASASFLTSYAKKKSQIGFECGKLSFGGSGPE
jgi:hypothetical protein